MVATPVASNTGPAQETMPWSPARMASIEYTPSSNFDHSPPHPFQGSPRLENSSSNSEAREVTAPSAHPLQIDTIQRQQSEAPEKGGSLPSKDENLDSSYMSTKREKFTKEELTGILLRNPEAYSQHKSNPSSPKSEETTIDQEIAQKRSNRVTNKNRSSSAIYWRK
jgi:hypothetical protein